MRFDFEQSLIGSLPELQRFARRLTKDASQAEDLAQDCIERALRYRDRFEPGTNLEAWLVTIMKNLHLTRCRRERRVTQVELTEDSACAAPAQIWPIMLREAGEAVERLSANQKTLIRIVVIDGCNYEEAAEALGVSIGTVRSRLSRARAELRSEQDAQQDVQLAERRSVKPRAEGRSPDSEPPAAQIVEQPQATDTATAASADGFPIPASVPPAFRVLGADRSPMARGGGGSHLRAFVWRGGARIRTGGYGWPRSRDGPATTSARGPKPVNRPFLSRCQLIATMRPLRNAVRSSPAHNRRGMWRYGPSLRWATPSGM